MTGKSFALALLGCALCGATLPATHPKPAPEAPPSSDLDDALQRAWLEEELILAERTAVMLGDLESSLLALEDDVR